MIASTVSARIDGLSAPPVIVSPRPRRMYGPTPIGAADLGQRDTRDEARAALGELALVEVGVVAEELDGDGLPEDGVAEELEALVGGDAAVLVRERPVREREQEQRGIDLDLQRLLQLVERAFLVPRVLRSRHDRS